MIGFGGWDWRNLLQAHTLAIILLFLLALGLLGLIHLAFRGSVVV